MSKPRYRARSKASAANGPPTTCGSSSCGSPNNEHASARAVDHCHRRALPAPRCRGPRTGSKGTRCTIGRRPLRGEAVAPAARSHVVGGGIWQARRCRVYLGLESRQGLAPGARARPRGKHVALPHRPHRDAPQCGDGDAQAGQRPRKAKAGDVLKGVAGSQAPRRRALRRPIRHLFLFTGAAPNANWLAGSGVALDAPRLRADRDGRRRKPPPARNRPPWRVRYW